MTDMSHIRMSQVTAQMKLELSRVTPQIVPASNIMRVARELETCHTLKKKMSLTNHRVTLYYCLKVLPYYLRGVTRSQQRGTVNKLLSGNITFFGANLWQMTDKHVTYLSESSHAARLTRLLAR